MPNTTHEYARELQFAQDLAQEASIIAMNYFRRDVAVKLKPDQSPVTEADETINQLVIEACKREFPNDGILGEEDSWHPERTRKWICDPIDGTADFVDGKSDFMFALSLDEGGQPVLAVALHPASGTMYHAIKHHGAYRDNERITTSTRSLADSRQVFPTNPQTLQTYSWLYEELRRMSSGVIHIHSSVFKGVKIADGTYDASVWPKTVHPWDVHSVALIVQEAGGSISDIYGNPYQYYDQELTRGVIVANNQNLHRAITDMVARSST